jgi:hypothetical protein
MVSAWLLNDPWVAVSDCCWLYAGSKWQPCLHRSLEHLPELQAQWFHHACLPLEASPGPNTDPGEMTHTSSRALHVMTTVITAKPSKHQVFEGHNI